uniref:Chromatin assembly factor 1 subunit A n=1 Tax=Parastrongyloides trichosuri TaxID=131310 RepID=A0A0N5A1D9_PARTI
MDNFIKKSNGKREPSVLSDTNFSITDDVIHVPFTKKLRLDPEISGSNDNCNGAYPVTQQSPLSNNCNNDSHNITTPNSEVRRKKLSKEDKEIKRLEREKIKKERELAAEQKRLEKERIAREREEERARKKKEEEEIKKKKEEERQAKELERAKKRQEEEEARRKREEERLAKKKEREEIEAKKEVERLAKKKEEEAKKLAKRVEEETKQKEEKMQSQILLNFLTKGPQNDKDKEEDKICKDNDEYIEIAGFQPFYVKEGTTMAPINRKEMLKGEKYDDFLKFSMKDDNPDYLKSIKKESFKTHVERILTKAKYYMFADSCRPPYFGTFRKKSKIVTGRRPFAQDNTLLDYDVESENEWEEEAEGDECRSDDETDDESKIYDDDEEGKNFFVEPGYLSEGEGQSEAEEDNSIEKISKISNKKKAEFVKKEWEQTIQDKKKKTKTKKLIPFTYGPIYVSSEKLDYNNLPPGILRSLIFDWTNFVDDKNESKNMEVESDVKNEVN